ncbi:MAG TPA: DMT family transporter [Catalimonadaceae bacterium]|nr:DMT family transporter [Catalimonadaceae bacterium]
MANQHPGLKDYLMLHLLIIFWGFTSILGVLSSLEAPILVIYRTGLSFSTLLIILYLQTKTLKLPVYQVGAIAAAGLLTAFHWTTFFASAQISNVSTCLAGMSTTALWTSLFEPLFFKKKFEWRESLLALLVSLGLVIIYRSDFSMALGLGISLASAIACSLFSILNRNLVRSQSALFLTTWEMGFAFVGCLLALPLLQILGISKNGLEVLPKGWDWLNILFLAWVCTVFAYTVSVELMKKFTAFAMNLTVNLEPVYGIVLGLLIFGQKEKMQPMFYVGLLLILGGVFIYPFMNKTKQPDR